MHTKSNISYIIIANILWSLIPVVVIGLFHEYSIITIIFLRFFIAGILLFALAILYILINNNYTSNEKISLKKLLKFTSNKNEEFYNLNNMVYISILGFFGIILQIIGYFLALKTTTIAFTMIGFQISIILVAFYEHGVKAEKLDLFKILYLIILIFSIAIIIFVNFNETHNQNEINYALGFYYVILYTLCLTFLHLGITRDSYSKEELILINKNANYKIPRLLIKLSLIFLTGILIMFPYILFIYFIPIDPILQKEISQFFTELSLIFQIIFRWDMFFLIIFATLIPFLLIFIASIKWSAYDLKYSQWNSILTIIEPIGAIFFGVLLVNEYFPAGYLIIIMFLLIISILFRYAHETKNKVNAYILLEKRMGVLESLPLRLLKFNGVCCVDSLIGTHDLLIHVKTNSIKDIYYLIDTEIRNLEGIVSIKILFINKIYKLNN